MRTALTDPRFPDAQVVLFTYKAPSPAQMKLLENAVGSEKFIQHVHGFEGLIHWVRFFFGGA
jgi:hypothetical protein